MTTDKLDVIDHSAQMAREWVEDLTGRLGWSSRHNALRLLRVTMHQIRDHLPINEVAQFSAQLPLLVRGMFFEGWVPKRTPLRQRDADVLIASIGETFGDDVDYRGLEDIACVFELLNARISLGEIEDVRSTLPSEIRALWPAP